MWTTSDVGQGFLNILIIVGISVALILADFVALPLTC